MVMAQSTVGADFQSGPMNKLSNKLLFEQLLKKVFGKRKKPLSFFAHMCYNDPIL